MPLMREWVEIHVEEDLLIHVVRELLSLAVDPNQVEVVYGTAGRVILAEVHLADAWYQMRLVQEEEEAAGTEVHAAGFEVVASAEVEPSTSAVATVPTPARRAPAVKPSASPDGEDT
jgi:hypothetical protein